MHQKCTTKTTYKLPCVAISKTTPWKQRATCFLYLLSFGNVTHKVSLDNLNIYHQTSGFMVKIELSDRAAITVQGVKKLTPYHLNT